MPSDDEVMSLADFSLTESSFKSSESGEFETVSIARPYMSEPLAHSSDESEEKMKTTKTDFISLIYVVHSKMKFPQMTG